MVKPTAKLSALIDHLRQLQEKSGDVPAFFIWEGISTPVDLDEVFVGTVDGEAALVLDADQDIDKGYYRENFGGC